MKGKQKAVEDDPIELYEDDSLSLDNFDRFDTPPQNDGFDIAVVRAESSLVANPESSSAAEQPVERLYKKMLALRTNVSPSLTDRPILFTLVLDYGSKGD
jgi:hypothetical protein